MKRAFKRLFPVLAVLAVAPAALGFSPYGPLLTWQTPALGYGFDVMSNTGPMSLNAFYRWNITNITYAFDESFIRYFGTDGMRAVDEAFAVLNRLPKASQINLDEFANDTKLINLQAAQAGLLDVKSHTLGMVFRYLGLTDPERYTWTLRYGLNGNYYVTQLSYDPYTLQPSSYVNGVQYSYRITGFGTNQFDAVEDPVTVDNNVPFSSVAGGRLQAGEVYLGLTRDDVGGIKYLLSTNTLAIEGLLPSVTGAGLQFGGSVGWIPWFGTTNAGGTNAGGITLTTNQSFFISQAQLTALTNASNFVVNGIRGGVEKISFTKVSFDSLIGSTFRPITNYFTDTVIVSNRFVTQRVQRVINYPDIVFVAEDLPFNADGTPVLTAQSPVSFQNNDALNGLAIEGGPGLITGGTGAGLTNATTIRVSFTTLLPGLINTDPFFLTDQWSRRSYRWGSFDATPTPPVIYPAGSQLTIDQLLNLVRSWTNSIPQ